MEVVQVLVNAVSPDNNTRNVALSQLAEMANQNIGLLLSMLANYVTRTDLTSEIRQIAALTAKNQLTSSDYDELELKWNRWRAIDEQTKAAVRALALQGLSANDARVGTAAAQFVSVIAAVDLSDNKWPDLIRNLLHNVQNSNVPLLTRASIEALGFICEEAAETASDVLAAQSGEILHTVVLGCEDRQPEEVNIAAIRSLYNSLEFVRKNFEREADRNFVMEVVCRATLKPNKAVKVSAFQCLVKIMSLYYEHMQPYMDSALYGLTVNAMMNETEEVVLQAIEFWSTVCDVESEIAFQAQEVGSGRVDRASKNYAEAALPLIMPQLLRMLTKQSADIDDEEWNTAKASSTCIYLLAKCVGKPIITFVLPFIELNIQKPEWQLREAALMAFGSILEGPSPADLTPLAMQAMPLLITSMGDNNIAVQDTAAWTVGVVCDLLHDATLNYLVPLLDALIRGLKAHPRVAASCAWAISNLAENLEPEDDTAKTYPLSAYFSQLVTALLSAVSRDDAGDANLRITGYAALVSLVDSGTEDTYSVLLQLAQVLLDRLNTGMDKPVVGADERREHVEDQANLCAALTSIVRKLDRQIAPLADFTMQVFLRVFTTPSTGRTAEIVEDAIIAIGAIADALGRDFKRYMDVFHPFLCISLQNIQEHTVCLHAVGLVGDVCRALGPEVLPYVEAYMSLLLAAAQNDQVHRDVKPHILSCFGDVAMAITDNFLPFLNNVMNVLRGASMVELPPNDINNIDYLGTLRQAVVEGYTGIIQVFAGPDKSRPLLQHCPMIVAFGERVYRDPHKAEELMRATVGMLGDLADSCGRPAGPVFVSNMQWISAMIQECIRTHSDANRETATWTQQRIRAATSA